MIDTAEILQRMRADFQAEAIDLLEELDRSLLALEGSPQDADLINRVFRALHTVKGSGASAQFRRLSTFAHKVEEVFNCVRERQIDLTQDLMDKALQSCDLLREFLLDGDATPALHQDLEDSLALSLGGFLPHKSASQHVSNGPQTNTQAGSPQKWEICFRPHVRLCSSGTDPLQLLMELLAMGEGDIQAHMEEVPTLDSIDPELCYGRWTVRLATAAGEVAMRDIFVFVADDCDLSIRLADWRAIERAECLIESEEAGAFLGEMQEQLVDLDNLLIRLERDPADRECIDAIFRLLHSVKGNAGLLLSSAKDVVGPTHVLRSILKVAHLAETSLEHQRETGSSSADEIGILFSVADFLRQLALSANQAERLPVPPAALLSWMETVANPASAPEVVQDPASRAFEETCRQCIMHMEYCLLSIDTWHSDPINGVAYLRSMKTLAGAANYSGRKSLKAMLEHNITEVQNALGAGPIDGAARIRLETRLKEIRTAATSPEAASLVAESPPPRGRRERREDSSAKNGQSIRVDQDKLDRLMRVVSELLVARGSLPMLAKRLDDECFLPTMAKELKVASAEISRISDELQTTVMSIRMLPIDTVFQRFPRLIRDLARGLNKDIVLKFRGEDTEVDKSVIQIIADPLVHIVRNAVDHGIETPARREAAGKSRAGTIELRARNEGTDVVIDIVDDGNGLDPERLVSKAMEKGLITAEQGANMSDHAAHRLILLPGFSTAETVTDLSGRGVGMDVAVSNIEKLKGTISIESMVGKGSAFQIRLPSSVMISRGILVECGEQEYILPTDKIADMIRVPATSLHSYRGGHLLQTKKATYSVASLREHFEVEPEEPQVDEICIAIIHGSKSRYGLIVDRFVTEVEVVIKRLTSGLQSRDDLLGASILGDGRVVLVLNLEADFV